MLQNNHVRVTNSLPRLTAKARVNVRVRLFNTKQQKTPHLWS